MKIIHIMKNEKEKMRKNLKWSAMIKVVLIGVSEKKLRKKKHSKRGL